MPSAKLTRKIPIAAGRSEATSPSGGSGTDVRQPRGNRPDDRHAAVGEIERPRTKIETMTTISAAGSLGRKTRAATSAPSAITLTSTVDAARVSELPRGLDDLAERLRVDVDTEQLSELPADEHDRDPVDVADEDGSGEVVGEPAEPHDPGEQEAGGDEQGEVAASSAASWLPAAASGSTAAPTSAEIAPSGPTISCRDDPSNVYSTAGRSRA